MKKNVFYLIFIFLFISCATNYNVRKFTDKELFLYDDLKINLISLSSDLSSVKINGNNYSAVGATKLITETKISIKNTGNKHYKFYELQALEIIFIKSSGELYFAQQASVFDIRNRNEKILHNGEIINETLYFIQNKDDVPVAITTNRQNKILLIDEANLRYTETISFLELHSNIEKMIIMANTDSFGTINDFRRNNNININAVNRHGFNLLFAGIHSKNDSVVIGAIVNGINLRYRMPYIIETIEPIHYAFLVHNKNAVEILLRTGAELGDIRTGGNLAAVIAVQSNNIETLKLLKEFGVDLTLLMIPVIRGASGTSFIPAIEYAKNRNRIELVQYLESL